ncbi:hypothetical protein ABKN59_006519 [Abortiporus biennis]
MLTIIWETFHKGIPTDSNIQCDALNKRFFDSDDDDLVFRPQTELRRGERTFKTFLGELSSSSAVFPDVVCKIRVDRFIDVGFKEARVYQRDSVQALQFDIFLNFYGHFTGLTTHGYSSCLLAEYEGEGWIDPNYGFELDTEVQKEILEVLGKMHDAGLAQSTLEFDLYRLSNGRMVSGFQPNFKEIPCNELHRVAKLLIFWKSRVLYYHNKPFDASFAINTDVYGLADQAPPTVSRESAIQDACKIILNYLRANFKDIYNREQKALYKLMQYYGRQEVQKRRIELLGSPFPHRAVHTNISGTSTPVPSLLQE